MVSLLEAGDGALIQAVVEAADFIGGILKYLLGDMAASSSALLDALRRRVVLNGDLGFHARSLLFTPTNLEQVPPTAPPAPPPPLPSASRAPVLALQLPVRCDSILLCPTLIMN